MDIYKSMDIPDTCLVDVPIYKKTFLELADLTKSDRDLITSDLGKVYWKYSIKQETMNIRPYIDETREYEEMAIIEASLKSKIKASRISEVIMRSIPYPTLLIFRHEDRYRISAAHQRTNLNDSSKNTLEDLIHTDWLDKDSKIFNKLSFNYLRSSNLYQLYSDIVDAINLHNAEALVEDIRSFTGTEARELTLKVQAIDKEIEELRAKIKKEGQFNRKVEYNLKIRKLQVERSILTGGDNR